jgi:hypothetical protein
VTLIDLTSKPLQLGRAGRKREHLALDGATGKEARDHRRHDRFWSARCADEE